MAPLLRRCRVQHYWASRSESWGLEIKVLSKKSFLVFLPSCSLLHLSLLNTNTHKSCWWKRLCTYLEYSDYCCGLHLKLRRSRILTPWTSHQTSRLSHDPFGCCWLNRRFTRSKVAINLWLSASFGTFAWSSYLLSTRLLTKWNDPHISHWQPR